MIRIGIAGSDNSHALAFARLANVERVFDDEVRVVAICGTEEQCTREVADKGHISHIVNGPDEMIGQVDAAMVVYRHADLHAPNALALIEAGLPVFVDKPFAIDLADARCMLDAAERCGTLLTSFSTLRFGPDTDALAQAAIGAGPLRVGVFTGPCDLSSEYGGAFFYGTHTIEIALRFFGEEVTGVHAVQHGGNVAATLELAGGALVTLNLMGNAHYVFHGLVVGADGYAAAPISTDGAYCVGMRMFVDMIRDRQRPLTDDQMLNPLRVLHAVIRALDTGRAVDPATIGG